ncbi:MAG: competence protein ComK [Acholeplasmataceae bacterium]
MIEYIKHEHHNTHIYQSDKIDIVSESAFSVIKKLCLDHLVTYEGYVKAIQVKYQKKQLIPLVLSDEISLIPLLRVRDYENIWVNSVEIKALKVKKSGFSITFMSGNTLEVSKSITGFKNALKLANMIKNEKVKHFHS